MTASRSITFHKSCPSLKLNNQVETKPVPWVFLETSHMPRKKIRAAKNSSNISSPPPATFGSDFLFSNSNIGFTKQELYVLDNAESRKQMELELVQDVSRVNLAKQIHNESKIAFENLLRKKEDEERQRALRMQMFTDPEDEFLITPRTPTSSALQKQMSRKEIENNVPVQEEVTQEMHTLDSSQMKQLILKSIIPPEQVRGSLFTKSDYSFTKNNHLNLKLSHGRRNIRHAIYSTCNEESGITNHLNALPDPKDMNLSTINRMRKYYGANF